MGTEAQAEYLLELFNLEDVERFSDPQRHLYQAFGLERTTPSPTLPRFTTEATRTTAVPRRGLWRSAPSTHPTTRTFARDE